MSSPWGLSGQSIQQLVLSSLEISDVRHELGPPFANEFEVSSGVAMFVSGRRSLRNKCTNLFVVCIVFEVSKLFIADDQLGAQR